MKFRLLGSILAGLFATAIVPALAQDARPAPGPADARVPVSGYPKPGNFPNANQAAIAEHFNRAKTIAGLQYADGNDYAELN